MNMRRAAGIALVFLFLFPVLGCVTVPTGNTPVTGYGRDGQAYVGGGATGDALVPAHEHRCPVDGLTWSHRKKSCAAPVAYACKEHKAARP